MYIESDKSTDTLNCTENPEKYSYCAVKYSVTFKKSLKFFSIISAEFETNTRIYGTICANHKKGNSGKEVEATRPCHDVRSKKPEQHEHNIGYRANCKP